MAEVDNLVLEHVHLIRQDLGEVRADIMAMKSDLSEVRGDMLAQKTMLFALAGVIGQIDKRAEHLETKMGA